MQQCEKSEALQKSFGENKKLVGRKQLQSSLQLGLEKICGLRALPTRSILRDKKSG
jgi:hypothetical protein